MKYLFFISLLCLYSCITKNSRFEYCSKKAEEALYQENYKTAISFYNRAIKNKEDAYCYENRGECYYWLGLPEIYPDTYYKYALDDYNKAIDLFSRDSMYWKTAECLMKLSILQYELNGKVKALEYLNKALTTDVQTAVNMFYEFQYDNEISMNVEFKIK